VFSQFGAINQVTILPGGGLGADHGGKVGKNTFMITFEGEVEAHKAAEYMNGRVLLD
jgi:hypothetical protein